MMRARCSRKHDSNEEMALWEVKRCSVYVGSPSASMMASWNFGRTCLIA